MKLTIAGCGDAFGSGGRLQTCYHVEARERTFLIDCGATAMIGLNRLGLDPNDVGTIFISHLHGDHFAGLVWWMIHAHHVGRRKLPLTIAGPPGIEQRYIAAAEALFPGSSRVERRFELRFVEMHAGKRTLIDGIGVAASDVVHPSGAPSLSLRLEVDGKTLAFSGDTEWTDNLLATSKGADLLIAECYGYETTVRYHMSWKVISENLARLAARRVLLVHMNTEMLANQDKVDHAGVIVGEDGLSLVI
jgi:ribonuclease BN (tRNA processing enzyme)